MEAWTAEEQKKFGGKQPDKGSPKIVKEDRYISHNSQIIEVGDEQVMIILNHNLGPSTWLMRKGIWQIMIILRQ